MPLPANCNRRPPITASALAMKWHCYRKAMNIRFQSLHFAINGPNVKFEACHRIRNLHLMVSSMKYVLDKAEFQDFEEDVQKELGCIDELDGMRCASVHIWCKHFNQCALIEISVHTYLHVIFSMCPIFFLVVYTIIYRRKLCTDVRFVDLCAHILCLLCTLVSSVQ